MKKDPRFFLGHIIDSVGDIESYLKNISHENFLKDKKTQDAVTRKLEIIGEAVKKLPASFKKQQKDIPWKEITGMRDVLIHEYFGVNLKIVWRTATKDILKLKQQLTELLKYLDRKTPQLRIR